MMDIKNQTWIGRQLAVISSSDNTLQGRSGIVVDETRETILIAQSSADARLSKRVIEFTIDDSSIIKGALVRQRAEDRIHRNYRKD